MVGVKPGRHVSGRGVGYGRPVRGRERSMARGALGSAPVAEARRVHGGGAVGPVAEQRRRRATVRLERLVL